MFPHLPPWRRAQAVQRLQRQERTRCWLWSLPYYPTSLLALSGIQVPSTHPEWLTLAGIYWLQHSALDYPFFEDLKVELTCRAGQAVRRAGLAASEAAVDGDITVGLTHVRELEEEQILPVIDEHDDDGFR